jgi:hypothetical protein
MVCFAEGHRKMDKKPTDGSTNKGSSRDLLFSNQDVTERRYQELRSYYERSVLKNGELKCKHKFTCRDSCKVCFSKASLPHIGRHYDMQISDKPQRLVVIGLDAPKQKEPCDLDQRRELFVDNLIKKGGPQNPHLRGTEQILRTMLGIENGKDDDDRRQNINGEAIYLFETFSFLNICMCSCAQGTSSRLTKKMKRNCSEHLGKALSVLEPTLIVLQGISSVWKIFEEVFEGQIAFDGEDGDMSGDIVEATLGECRVLAFHHPSYPAKNWGWGTKENGYFRCIVKPALEEKLGA